MNDMNFSIINNLLSEEDNFATSFYYLNILI